MNRKVRIIGKKLIPMWLIAFLLIASGTGAAVGSVVAGKISGEINVSTTGSAGGLQIGGPYCDIIQHTPNEAREGNINGNYDNFSDLAEEFNETEYANIAFPDNVYAEHTTLVNGVRAQHGFKFTVGDEANISKIVVEWEGYATLDRNNGLRVTEGDSDTSVVAREDIYATDTKVTIKLTGTDVTDAVDNGFLYVIVNTLNQNAGNGVQTIYTDYIVATVTYTAIDLANWTGFRGIEMMTRNFHVPSRCIGVHSDDQTGFEAASEIAVGDWWLFMLPIRNASSQDITARLTMEVPSCLNVYASAADEMDDYDPRIHRVTRIGHNTWKFIVDANADKQDDDDYLYIAINAHDDCGPAYYIINGILEQIPY